jgi:hypothetical protein
MSDAQREEMTFKLAGDYARWFVASLLLLNAGAIAAIFNKTDHANYRLPLALFGLGIASALLCAFFGWQNLQTASRYYRHRVDGVHQDERVFERARRRYMCLSLVSLFASSACLFVGALVLWWRFTG